ncbi:hypothetical protein O3Q51_00550 [Cryomorphaceae bacterium 1068]|nr:hypothetical protein [Cryomorphaceae bacterium 1068]
MRLPALLIAFLAPFLAFTQSDVSKYFDDGGMSNLKNAYKIDLMQSVGGDLTFAYERFIWDVFSIEVGAAVLLKSSVVPFNALLDGSDFTEKRDGGYKFIITPMLHPYEDPMNSLVYGMQFFVRQGRGIESGNPELGKYDRRDTYIAYYQGYRLELADRFSGELAFTLGALFAETPDLNVPVSSFLDKATFNMTVSLKLSFHS